MALDAKPVRTNLAEVVTHRLFLLGANGADPSVVYGAAGVTVTRTGEGAYRVAFGENPGTFVGFTYGFGATTPGDLKGYTVVHDEPFDTTNYRFDFVVYDSTFTAADIIAAQHLTLHIDFARSNVNT